MHKQNTKYSRMTLSSADEIYLTVSSSASMSTSVKEKVWLLTKCQGGKTSKFLLKPTSLGMIIRSSRKNLESMVLQKIFIRGKYSAQMLIFPGMDVPGSLLQSPCNAQGKCQKLRATCQPLQTLVRMLKFKTTELEKDWTSTARLEGLQGVSLKRTWLHNLSLQSWERLYTTGENQVKMIGHTQQHMW